MRHGGVLIFVRKLDHIGTGSTFTCARGRDQQVIGRCTQGHTHSHLLDVTSFPQPYATIHPLFVPCSLFRLSPLSLHRRPPRAHTPDGSQISCLQSEAEARRLFALAEVEMEEIKREGRARLDDSTVELRKNLGTVEGVLQVRPRCSTWRKEETAIL